MGAVAFARTATGPLTFEEVDFPVPAPDERRVDVIGHAGETFGQILRVTAVQFEIGVAPIARSLHNLLVALIRANVAANAQPTSTLKKYVRPFVQVKAASILAGRPSHVDFI